MRLCSFISKSVLFIIFSLIIEFCSLLSLAQDIPTNSSVSGGSISTLPITAIANSTQIPSKQFPPIGLSPTGISPISNLSRSSNGGLSENKSFDGGNYYEDDEVDNIQDNLGQKRGMRSDKKKEKTRLALLKQIQSLDHMKCFPKVLCGLSVDSSKNSKELDSYFVRSYIQLMRSASNPDDLSSEEFKTSTSSDPQKDALTIFLMKSGLLKPKPKSKQGKHRQSHSASSSEEGSYEDRSPKSKGSDLLQKRNQALKRLLSKRRLTNDKELISKYDHVPYGLRPILHLSNSGQDGKLKRVEHEPLSILHDSENHGSVTSQIGSLVSSWVPWVNLSFGKDDSFEKDPFFRGGAAAGNVKKKNVKEWEQNLDRLAMLMAAKDAEIRRKKKNKGKDDSIELKNRRSIRDLSGIDDEISVYSTAVDIGKKLKDTKQCDYLYNGCPVAYDQIIKIIASIRKDIKESEESVESLSKEILQYAQKDKQDSKQSSRKPSQKNKQPMTQISHTLPNGEKVEINVQLSPKNENEDGEVEIESPYGDSDVPNDEVEENENIDDPIASHPMSDPLEVDANGDDPAISASYELAGETLVEDDHSRPSPSHIFSKLNKRKKASPSPTPPPTTPTPPPKYIVSKKRRPTSVAPIRKPRPKPSQTPPRRRTPPIFATSQKPTHRPTRPTRQPTVQPRLTSRPVLKSGKVTTTKPKIKTKNKTVTTPTIHVEDTSSEDGPEPMWSKIATSSGTVPSTTSKKGSGNRPIQKGSTNSGTKGGTKKASMKRTTERPAPIYDDDDSHASSKITIEIDKSEENVADETNNSEETVTSKPIPTTTTRKPLRSRPTSRPTTTTRTTTTTTTTTTTPSPLSLLTQSYYDQVVADMFKTTRSPTRKPTAPPPTTPPSKRRRKPINYNKNSQYSHPNRGQGFNVSKNNSATIDETYAMSVESGSGEVRPFNMAQLGEIGNPNPWTELTSTTPKPGLSHDMDDPTDVGNGANGKKRITYKNGKRPYLVLMKPGTGIKLKTPGQLSPATMDPDYNSQPPQYPVEENAPLVIEPGTSDYSHWSPNH